MAATDKTLRNQKTLNIVFAISCVLMLLSIFWMLEQDYNRSYKEEQRTFRKAEELVFLRMMLDQLPPPNQLDQASIAVAKARAALRQEEVKLNDLRVALTVERDKADADFRNWKAEFDSKMSYRNIAAEHYGEASDQVKKYDAMLAPGGEIKGRLDEAQKLLDDINARIETEIDKPLQEKRDALAAAEDNLKKLAGTFDRFAKVVTEKTWGAAETTRNLPILDAFASPTRIKQQYLPELTIDYGGFKRVPRFDRCATCHLGIDRASFDRESLLAIGQRPPASMRAKLETAHEIFKARQARGEKLAFDLDKLPEEIGRLNLSSSRITEYAAHPRLDLFVDANSPHPLEDYGCTVCHRGQGSATDFVNAAHTPNTELQMERWKDDAEDNGGHHWHRGHYWDFPMLPSRFTESSCLQCHHEVTELIRDGSKEEAPRLLEGYRLVRDNGCFGCHEISGRKSEREVGPDMRTEPLPALEWLPPEEVVKMKADTLNPPGTYRRVGPGLRRLAEKTNEAWLRKWLASPRGFRPGTKMPHFYNLSTNDQKYLEAHAPSQKHFPDAEMYAIARYLHQESKQHLKGEDITRQVLKKELERLQKTLINRGMPLRNKKALDKTLTRLRDIALLAVPTKSHLINEIVADIRQAQDALYNLPIANRDKNPVKAVLGETVTKKTAELLSESDPVSVAEKVFDSKGNSIDVGKLLAVQPTDANQTVGRALFSEKGCLACHSHVGTMENGSREAPNVSSDAEFGPNLTRVAAKLGNDAPNSARRWLIQWLLNPNIHNARTRMPITHLTPEEANQIAIWLMSQKVEDWEGQDQDIPKPSIETMKTMAKIYLGATAAIGRRNMEKVANEGISQEYINNLPPSRKLPFDADEQILVVDQPGTLEEKLTLYVGKKAVSRMGCFGCHDIPGFEGAKPIGTPLNDWGQKDPARLAFEDSVAFADHKLAIVDFLIDPRLMDLVKAVLDGTGEEGEFPTVENRIVAVRRYIEGNRFKQAQLGQIARVAQKKALGTTRAAREKIAEWAERYGIEGVKTERDFFAKDNPDAEKEEKRPMERYFYSLLKDHQREGFLALKLMQPRSYDYGRLRNWEDRLRMPQFRFSRTQRRPGESVEEYKARRIRESEGEYDQQAQLEEANAREAVMTFILGLVAEPIPAKYINEPKPERKQIVEGRKVLEQYNCAGCHEVRPGTYRLNIHGDNEEDILQSLKDSMQKHENDHSFSATNAWIGQLQSGDQLMLHAAQSAVQDDQRIPLDITGAPLELPLPSDPPPPMTLEKALNDPGSDPWFMNLRLSRALRFEDQRGLVYNIPAGESVAIPLKWLKAENASTPWGGALANLLNPYLRKKDSTKWGDETNARASLPPPLLREGERVRPDWLFSFLLDPEKVRPLTVLRMPKFNMSKEEAQALVNYFAAVDKTENPKMGLTEPFMAPPQQSDAYWKGKTEQYLSRFKPEEIDARLKEMEPIWKLYLNDAITERERIIENLDKTVKSLDEEVKGGDADAKSKQDAAKLTLEATKKELEDLKNQLSKGDFKAFEQQWKERDAYAADAYRLLTDRTSICLTCHSVGNIITPGEKAPNLMHASQRLRPEWTGQWIAHPNRLSAYPALMNANFPAKEPPPPALFQQFKGSQRERALAIRDILMNFPDIAERPVNRYYPMAPKGGK